jgi:glycosyltransferase involved in cell wall biosynthesis
METLNNNGVKARMLVRDKETDALTVAALSPSWPPRWHFLYERFTIWLRLHLQRRHLFDVDTACCGSDVTGHPWFREADIIHLHWINQGMLSLKGIRKILESGKRVVWTMHDIWPATSLCHLTLDCRNFESQCHHCRLLPGGGSDHDLSARVWQRKQQMLSGQRITFVACSQWLAGEARRSALLKGQDIVSVPNAIDSRIYRPGDKAAARQALGLPPEVPLILFVSQRATNPYKGMDYLIDACRLLAADAAGPLSRAAVVILGGHAEEIVSQLPFPAYPLGYISEPHRIAQVYQASDVFVLPSLSENLPNTIMEAMACGVPCVGFRVGGIPEMIDHHENGYVANYRDAADLAEGLRYVLSHPDYASLSRNCIQKVSRNYSQQAVAARYIKIYDNL